MASPVKDAKNKHVADGFTEVAERGRGYLRSRKPGTNQYALTTQVGGVGWHRGNGPYTEADEVDTAWVQNGVTYDMLLGDPFQAQVNLAQQSYRYEDMDTGESVELFAESVLQWTNGTQVELAAGLSAPSVGVDDDTITFDGLFGAGTRLSIQAQTARLKKLLTIDSLGLLSTPTLSGTVSLSFSLRFQRSAGVSIWVDGAEWDENSSVSSTTAIEFRASSGEVLFVFSPVYALDSSEEPIRQDGVMNLKKVGANLFADVLIPYTFIQTAVYPIVIDPTINPVVGTGADDSDQRPTQWISTDNFLRMGYLFGSDWDACYRFDNLSFSGTVDDAYLSFVAHVDDSGAVDDLTVYAYDASDPAAPTTESEFTTQQASPTTATFSYAPGSWTEASTYTTGTNSANAVIQELVDSYTYDGTQAAIIYCEAGATGDWRRAVSYEGNSSNAAVLHIEYTAAASSTPAPMPTFRPV